MATNKQIRFGPVAMSTSATNIINTPTITGGTGLSGTNSSTYVILRQVRLTNKTSSAVTASLFIGATGGSSAGTEFFVSSTTIPPNSSVPWYGTLRLDTADYLTGLAGTTAAITFEAEGEIGVAG